MIIILVIYLMIAGFFMGLTWNEIEDIDIWNFIGMTGVSLVWIIPFIMGIISGLRNNKEEEA